MNILPKKNWHVRNKDNVAKVRKDEAKAAAEEEERLRRHALAEQEARTDLLRQIARKRHGEDDSETQLERAPAKHINFFEDLEDGRLKHGTNKEYEAEKRAAQENFEKKIGLLTYLGQSSSEGKGTKPWYELPRTSLTEQEIHRKVRDDERKGASDPLNNMIEYIDQKKDLEKEYSGDIATSRKSSKSKSGKSHHHRDRASEKDRHSRRPSASTDARRPESVTDGNVDRDRDLQKLREERIRRERAERLRAETLLAKVRGERQPADRSVDERRLRYNTVYYPSLNKS